MQWLFDLILPPNLPMDLGPSSSSSNAESSATTASAPVAKEHMFDKVVTPSDVGKLNRLVIPKQHAEKHLPLDPSSVDKGLLLSFEDRSGKPWRFRYSYWSSSQSYVMTKGWSRFVKEKRLHAGDTVSFARALGAKDRLFIDWKRATDTHGPSTRLHLRVPMPPPPNYYPMLSFASPRSNPWGGRLLLPAAAEVPMVLHSVPVGRRQEMAAGKRVRLFGVNLDSLPPSPLPLPSPLQQQAISSSSSSPTPSGNEEQHSLDLEL